MDLEFRADAAVASIPTDGRHRWLELVARAGYAARGLVYAIVGGLAMRAAVGGRGGNAGPRQALRDLATSTWGVAVLAMLAFGLAGFALWRFVQGIRDTEGFGHGVAGMWSRTARCGSGLVHLGWAVLAASLVLGHDASSANENAQAQGWTATLLQQPFGRWLVAAVGILVASFAVVNIRMCYSERFAKHVAVDAMRARTHAAFMFAARAGLTARAVVFAIIGGFLVVAAWRYDPSQASGLGGALDRLLEQPYGTVLLAVVGFGLLLFGVYNAFMARFRVIRAM